MSISTPIQLGTPDGDPLADVALTQARGRRRLRVNVPLALGGFLVGAMVLVAVFAPLIAPYDPNFQHPDGLAAGGIPIAPGDAHFILGTDTLGRDMLSRLMYGARAAIFIAIVPNVCALVMATIVAVPAGYFGGRTERVLLRLIETAMVLPAFLLALAFLAVLGAGLEVLIIALVMVSWSQPARVIYGETLRIRELAFVEAARAAGATHLRIMVSHILPQLRGLLAMYFALSAVVMVVAEASFSFLGFGIQPPTPSWGAMIAEARQLFFWPWLILLPGVCLALVGTGFYLLGIGIQQLLGVRQDRVRL